MITTSSRLALPRGAAARGSQLAALATVFCILWALAAAPAAAQSWPQRSVRFILPFGAGGALDVAARLIGERTGAKWGKPVVIENRPGGDGLLAINAFLSANDDHVLLYASTAAFIAHPYTQEKLPYELERDLIPIARLTDTVSAISVPAVSAHRTVADFFRDVRAMPEKFNFVGAGGLTELTLDAFLKSEGLKATRVPYRDPVQAARDLGENRIQFLSGSLTTVQPLVEAGKVRIIAVASRQRSPLLKDVPSIVELGYPGLVVESTAGLYGPKGMSLELRRRIGEDVMDALRDPAIAARVTGSGQDIRLGGPEELAATLRQQSAHISAIAKTLGMARKSR